MRPRIKGLETEYSIKLKKGLQVENMKPQVLNNPEKMVGSFLPNGARYYLDGCKYPEYATPECLTVKDVVASDKAGEKIILKDFEQISLSVQKSNYGLGQEGFFNLRKGTRGCHENYLINEQLMCPPKNPPLLVLVPFLISRQIITGRGGLILTADNQIYPVISKRTLIINTILHDGTTMNRAIICTARTAETHSNFGHRLHLILSDSNLSEYSTFLKIGITDLTLTLLENNFLPPLNVKNHPVQILWNISLDTEFKKTYEVILPSGEQKKFSALDIQFWYLNLAQEFFGKIMEPTDEEKFILNLWQETLDALKRDPMSLSDRLDYLIVLRLLEEAKDVLGSSITDEKLKTIDVLYSEMLPTKSWYLKQLKTGNIKRLLTDEEINQAFNSPPANTRAKLRGEFIELILKEKIGERFSINWDYILFLNLEEIWSLIRRVIPTDWDDIQQLNLKNPYQTENHKYNSFKELVITAAEKIREIQAGKKKGEKRTELFD